MPHSSKPSKQRKLLWNAPLHRRHKLMAAPLSAELRIKHGRRAFPVRKGDVVQILRGDYAGMEGKIRTVNLKKYRVTVEGVTREKSDGTNVFVPIHPSKVMVKKLNLEDKLRRQKLAEKPVEELPSEKEEG